MVSKEEILNKTHYGTGIYSHILRQNYPDEIVMCIVGRDCGLCRNPFNDGKKTLHVWIEKTDPTNAMSAEFARHEDSENAVPSGDAFGFAELHYKQSGAELLQTLNKEMNLRIGEKRDFYANAQKISTPIKQSFNTVESPSFSFFKAPVSNIKPHKAVSLLQIYNAIKGDYYKERTEHLRKLADQKQARQYKATNFDYCTFSGIFSSRNDKALIQHSNMLCVDFDHVEVEKLRFQLLDDEYFDTLLLFRSPSGDGLKWIIPIDVTQATHANYFLSVSNYLKATYNVEADKSGKDISRACFIPHDSEAFINPIYLKTV
ncbi:MAG: hypothetical protein LBB41_03000 [Prevotellaceae bacterium]|jgi:hypothetical protein|nr:hypothetical protein [Prevotellaceae bacterium]